MPPPALHPRDPRNYLIRQNSLTTTSTTPADLNPKLKIRRTKTSLLPLETIPPGFETHNLSTTISMPVSGLAQLVKTAAKTDMYVREGDVEVLGLSQKDLEDSEVVGEWKWESWGRHGLMRVCSIVAVQRFVEEGGDADVDLGKVLREWFLGGGGGGKEWAVGGGYE